MNFDEIKYFLGKLCSNNHEYKDTGKSLRHKNKQKTCIICKKNTDSRYYLKNENKIVERTKQWKLENKKKSKSQIKKYQKKNSLNTKKWRINNREKYLKNKREYRKKKLSNPEFRISHNISKVICKWLNGNKNGKHWEDIVGYSINDLISHLEKQFDSKMNWNNYGKYWELDHIIPISIFNFTSYKDIDFKKCWSLNNLRPLKQSINRSKSNKIEKDFQPSLAL